jgi:hypothetical protein
LNFVSISTFRNSCSLITKRAENGYGSCKKDICNELKDLTFDNIASRHYLVKQIGHLRVIKLRIQNSDQNISSAAGYRLIIICNSKYDHIAFLEIYPKKGKYSKSDLTKTEYKNILNTYGNELKNGTLVPHNINKELEEIKKEKSQVK